MENCLVVSWIHIFWHMGPNCTNQLASCDIGFLQKIFSNGNCRLKFRKFYWLLLSLGLIGLGISTYCLVETIFLSAKWLKLGSKQLSNYITGWSVAAFKRLEYNLNMFNNYNRFFLKGRANTSFIKLQIPRTHNVFFWQLP